MNEVGQQLAIKHVTHDWWRVYTVEQSERFGPYTKVLRDDAGRIRNFHDEEAARAFIESMPDAIEVEYPI